MKKKTQMGNLHIHCPNGVLALGIPPNPIFGKMERTFKSFQKWDARIKRQNLQDKKSSNKKPRE